MSKSKMNYMLFWLYIILLILTSFAVSFVLTYKLTDTSVSNLYWVLGGVAFLVWLMVLVGIWFVIRPKMQSFMKGNKGFGRNSNPNAMGFGGDDMFAGMPYMSNNQY